MSLFLIYAGYAVIGAIVGKGLWWYVNKNIIKPLELEAKRAENQGYLKGVNDAFLILNDNILNAFEKYQPSGKLVYETLKEIMMKNDAFITKAFPQVKLNTKMEDIFDNIETMAEANKDIKPKNGLLN